MPLGLPAAWRRGPIGGLDSTALREYVYPKKEVSIQIQRNPSPNTRIMGQKFVVRLLYRKFQKKRKIWESIFSMGRWWQSPKWAGGRMRNQ